ncbi:MAG: sugar kinase [Conexivisphaerales archaeon]
MPHVISIGEPLIQLNAVDTGPIRYNRYFEKHVAGSELNFCIGASRSGLSSGIIAKVGDDEFGLDVLQYLLAERVDISHVRIAKGLATGVYFIQRSYPVPGKSIMYYYRKGSAGSTLSTEDVKESYFDGARLVHLTGITPALSETAREAWLKVLEIAISRGIKISLYTNIRPKLLSADESRELLKPAAERSYILLTDPDDMRIMYESSNIDETAMQLVARGVEIVVVKLGPKGSIAYTKNGVFRHRQYQVPVVDPVGAGDAFASLFVSSILKGWKIKRALEAATVAGSLVVMRRGDNENIPSEEDIKSFLSSMRGSD